MAYKNKNKQKAHVAKLKETGWRKDDAKKRAVSQYMTLLRNMGIPSSQMDDLVKQKFGY